MTSSAIRVRGLEHRFGALKAVDGLDLDIQAGSVVALIGPNGAGKTTTLRLMAGLLEPTAGTVHIMGHHVGPSDDRWRWAVGYMPDFFGVYDRITSREYLDFFARSYLIPDAERPTRVSALLDLMDLGAKADVPVKDLSRGMQQRLGLARVLVHDPPVLLLDEPASGLDPRARVEMRELLRELRTLSKTVVISSHVLSELAHLCDVVVVMDAGRMRAAGSLQEVAQGLAVRQVVRVYAPADRLLSALESHADAEAIQVPGREANQVWLDIELAHGQAARAALLAHLMQAGVDVTAFIPLEQDLEGLFLRVTEGPATPDRSI